MLHFVTQTLQQFLSATVAPPAPELRPFDWVRIGRVNEPRIDDGEDTLILHLFHLEPNSMARMVKEPVEGPKASRSPLLLDLHYAITYRSESQETCEVALGSVLKAFHSAPSLRARDYLTSKQTDSNLAGIPDRLDVQLMEPNSEFMHELWGGSGSSNGLTLYYKVVGLRIESEFLTSPDSVTLIRPPIPQILHPGKQK